MGRRRSTMSSNEFSVHFPNLDTIVFSRAKDLKKITFITDRLAHTFWGLSSLGGSQRVPLQSNYTGYRDVSIIFHRCSLVSILSNPWKRSSPMVVNSHSLYDPADSERQIWSKKMGSTLTKEVLQSRILRRAETISSGMENTKLTIYLPPRRLGMYSSDYASQRCDEIVIW